MNMNEWYNKPSISQEHHVLHNTLDVLSCPGRVHGHIDQERMTRALRTVVAQHPSLRTRFTIDNGTVHRELLQLSAMPLVFIEKNFSSAEALQLFVAEFEQQQRQQLPKRQQGPLFSCAFIIDSPETSIFLLTIDHLICDAWSIKLFSDALFTAYEQDLDAAHLQINTDDVFGDFAQWQRNKIMQSGQAIADHWAKKSAPALDFSQPPARLQKKLMVLSPEMTTLVESTAKQTKISLFTYLLSAFHFLLMTWSKPPSSIRMVHSGRFRHQFKSAIGLFASSVLVETANAEAATFADLLKLTQRSLHQAIKWSYVPIEYIQSLGNEEVSRARIEIDYMPLDLFTHPGKLLQVSTLLDVTLAALQPDLDMQLLCYSQNKQLSLFFIYNEAVFPDFSDHLSHFESGLLKLIESPQMPLVPFTTPVNYAIANEKNTIPQ